MSEQEETKTKKQSLIRLVISLPSLLSELIKSEIAQLKSEFVRKLKHAGIGIGFFLVAAMFGFFATAVLTAAAILGLAVVVPAWLAALIVAGVLLVFVTIFIILGVGQFKKSSPQPTETMDSVRRDMHVIKGTKKRGTP